MDLENGVSPLPVRVGIGRTKTQAKLASLGAKADLTLDGVCHLYGYDSAHYERIHNSIPVGDLWGVGRQLTKRLNALNIHTVAELRDSDLRYMRKKFSVNMAGTIMELRGISCIPLEDIEARKHKDQLIYSRSFSTPVRGEKELKQVLSIYAQKVSSRLREQGLVADIVNAWTATAYYKEGYETANLSVALPFPTDDPIWIGKASHQLIERMNPDAPYVRAGVVLMNLKQKDSDTPLDLFQPLYEGKNIGATLDSITQKLGRNSIGIGFGGLKAPPAWNMKRNMLSKRATTVWEELPIVKAG